MQCYFWSERLLALLTNCTFNSTTHLTTCPHASSPHHDPCIRVSRPLYYGLPCGALWWQQQPCHGGWCRCWWRLPSPSTYLSKISPGSFLCPLILGFKATKGQAADRKNSHESPQGARRSSHTSRALFVNHSLAMTSRQPVLRIRASQARL